MGILLTEVFPAFWHIAQYHRLNALMDMYGDLNFTVLGFPCNQFGLQTPGECSLMEIHFLCNSLFGYLGVGMAII